MRQHAKLSTTPKVPSATGIAPAPTVLNEAQTAALLGISPRTLLKLRHEAWFPTPLQLGPRATRWLHHELIEALAKQAPRGGVQQQPEHLTLASQALRSLKQADETLPPAKWLDR